MYILQTVHGKIGRQFAQDGWLPNPRVITIYQFDHNVQLAWSLVLDI